MKHCVLHVLCSLDERDGGPVRAVFDLNAAALEFGYESEILGFGPEIRVASSYPTTRIHVLPGGRLPSFGDLTKLIRWLDANLHRYDGIVLHGMWIWQLGVCAYFAFQSQTPYACFPHGMLDLWPWRGQGLLKHLKKRIYWSLLEHLVIDHSKHVFFTTQRELDHAHSLVKINSTQSLVLPYGVSFLTNPVERPDRSDLMKNEEERWCLFLSRIHPKKNLEFLLNAWKMANVPIGMKLIIAGTGEMKYLKLLHNIVKKLGLASSVRFVGHVAGNDKVYLFQKSELFLLASSQENFGVAVLEAIHHGCPVFVSNEVYISDFFHPDYPVLPLDLQCWAKAISRFTKDREYRELVRGLNADYLRPRFSMAFVSRAWGRSMLTTFSEAQTTEES